MVFTALEGAGHIVGLQMGFSLANIINPLTSTNASLIDQFYTLVATLVFLTIDGHHIVLLGIERTFLIAPIDAIGSTLPPQEMIFGLGREIFATASRMALPVLTALLLTDVALAMVARSVPQLNVFVVGMPAKIAVGFVMLIVGSSALEFVRMYSLKVRLPRDDQQRHRSQCAGDEEFDRRHGATATALAEELCKDQRQSRLGEL